MSELSDRTESDGDEALEPEIAVTPEASGWDVQSNYPIQNNLATLIKLANSKLPLIEVLREYHINNFENVWSSKGWTQKRICPFPDHQDDSPSFYFNPKFGKFHCFGCSRTGKAAEFLSFFQQKPIKDICIAILNSKLSYDQVVEEILENEDQKIEELITEFGIFVRNFVLKHRSDKGVKFSESVSWTLDTYLREKYANQKPISLENLAARISKLKDYLNNYQEE